MSYRGPQSLVTVNLPHSGRCLTDTRPLLDRHLVDTSTEKSTVSRPTYRPLPSIEAPYKTQDPILPQASGSSFRTEVVLISEKNEPRWTQRKCERKRKKLRRSATVENPAVYMKNTNKVTTLELPCDFYVTRDALEWHGEEMSEVFSICFNFRRYAPNTGCRYLIL